MNQNINSFLKLSILSLVVIFLTACGGSGTPSGLIGPDVPTKTLSGTITYTSFKLSDAGIDYANPITKPIRGAIIQLQDSSGNIILESAKTTDSGGYSFNAPVDSDIRIVVWADIGNTRVIDNTNNNKLYSITSGIHHTDTVEETKDLHADSGWDSGGTTTGEREAAPFNILDLIYTAQKKIQEVDITADAIFTQKPLKVNWSKNNGSHAPLKDAEGKEDISNGGLGDGTAGSGASSYDRNLNLLILGKADEDTDEYDAHTILHEWFHYFEDELSNSDSIGGNHSAEDVLHPSLAFGEGFAYAFAAMILNDPLYYQTEGVGSKDVDFTNYEVDSVVESKTFTNEKVGDEGVKIDGFYSEASIIEVLWDLYDDSDDEDLALGFAPIYKVIIGGQKTTKSFTSIVSFLHHLKIQQPDSADKINTIAQAENINMANADEFQILDRVAAEWPTLYTSIDLEVTVTTDAGNYELQTWNNFGEITLDDEGGKLFNYQFLKTTIVESGCYTLTVTPTGLQVANANISVDFPEGLALDINLAGGNFKEEAKGVRTISYPWSEGILAFSVSAKNDGNGEMPFSVLIASTPNACP